MFQQLYKTAIRASGPSTTTDLWSKGEVSSSAEPGSQTSLDSAARTEASSSWAVPGYTRDSCWAGSLNQDQYEPGASSNWQQSQRHPKQGLTPMFRNCTGVPAQVTAFQLPGMPSTLLPHTATLCPDSREQGIQMFCTSTSKMNEADFWFYSMTLH